MKCTGLEMELSAHCRDTTRKKYIANQVKQWTKEFGLEEAKFEKEKIESIVDRIFEAIKLAHGLGGSLAMGKFTKV